jgi:hypothetical protein
LIVPFSDTTSGRILIITCSFACILWLN